MTRSSFSRRQFGKSLSLVMAAPVLAPLLAERAEARLPLGAAPGTIQLDANENPYGPSPRALAALTQSEQVAARYPFGTVERARKAIAARHRQHGVEPANVCLGCGSTQILRAADYAFLGPGKKVVVADPTFEAVLDYAKVEEAKAVKVPLDARFRSDLRGMLSACGPETGLVYLCNPNNPTGTIVHSREMETFIQAVPASAVILVDEAYYDFVEDPGYDTAIPLALRMPNVIVARTFSKVFGLAGMRLGYAIARPATIANLHAHLSSDNANAGVLAAAMASLDDPDVVPNNKKRLNDTRRWLVAEMHHDGRRVLPSEANFVMIHLGRDVQPVITAFAARNIRVGRKFPSMPEWLRVSIGTPGQMQAFVTALRQIVPAQA